MPDALRPIDYAGYVPGDPEPLPPPRPPARHRFQKGSQRTGPCPPAREAGEGSGSRSWRNIPGWLRWTMAVLLASDLTYIILSVTGAVH